MSSLAVSMAVGDFSSATKWVDFENRSTIVRITDFLLEGGNLVTKFSTI